MFRTKSKVLTALLLVLVFSLCAICLVACNDQELADLQAKIDKNQAEFEQQLAELQAKINGYEADYSEKTVTVYVGDECLEVTTRQAFLHTLLKELKKDGKISAYEYSGGEVSPFITQIDDLQQDSANGKYYSVWHNVDSQLCSVVSDWQPSRVVPKDIYGTSYATTTYHEVELYYSNVGVGYIPVVDGCVYAILVD